MNNLNEDLIKSIILGLRNINDFLPENLNRPALTSKPKLNNP
ncbi:hypothetical protein [Aliivibrio fischeri]|nr:hypothetical protein [Aliivibrio fischeri]